MIISIFKTHTRIFWFYNLQLAPMYPFQYPNLIQTCTYPTYICVHNILYTFLHIRALWVCFKMIKLLLILTCNHIALMFASMVFKKEIMKMKTSPVKIRRRWWWCWRRRWRWRWRRRSRRRRPLPGGAPRTSGGSPRSLHPRFPLLLLVAGSLPPAGVGINYLR